MVVLSEDPLIVEPDRLMRIRVEMTMIDGQIRYRPPGAELEAAF